MKFRIISLLLVILMSIGGCKKNKPAGNAGVDKELPNLPPVETRAPNTDYSPAFDGQTRAHGMKTETSLKINILSGSLQKPWGITSLPDSNWLITQKESTMVILRPDGPLKATISGYLLLMPAGRAACWMWL